MISVTYIVRFTSEAEKQKYIDSYREEINIILGDVLKSRVEELEVLFFQLKLAEKHDIKTIEFNVLK